MKEFACLGNQGPDVLKDTWTENEAGCQGKIGTRVFPPSKIEEKLKKELKKS